MHGVNQATNFVVGEGEVAGEILKQAQVQFLLISGKRVPRRYPIRTRCKFRVLRGFPWLELASLRDATIR
jgi:hypothetical protein